MIKYRHDFWKERGSIMSKKLKTEAVDHLFDAILCLQNREECYTFFEDVCTVNELLSLSQRFEVAGMLRDQKTYLDIAEKTGASGDRGENRRFHGYNQQSEPVAELWK